MVDLNMELIIVCDVVDHQVFTFNFTLLISVLNIVLMSRQTCYLINAHILASKLYMIIQYMYVLSEE